MTAAGSKLRSEGISGTELSGFALPPLVLLVLLFELELLLWLSAGGGTLGGPVPPPGVWADPGVPPGVCGV